MQQFQPSSKWPPSPSVGALMTETPNMLIERLRQRLAHVEWEVRQREVGYVVRVGDGVAYLRGMPSVRYGELLECHDGLSALAFDLRPHEVGALFLGQRTRWRRTTRFSSREESQVFPWEKVSWDASSIHSESLLTTSTPSVRRRSGRSSGRPRAWPIASPSSSHFSPAPRLLTPYCRSAVANEN